MNSSLWIVIWTLIFSMVFLVMLIGISVASGYFLRREAVRLLRCESKGKLVLTYDDGPYIESIFPELLDLLGRYQIKATFFLLGFRVNESPDLCDRLKREGHDIGSHGYWHYDAWRYPFHFIRDTMKGRKAIDKWAKPNIWYRPPKGRITIQSWWVLKRHSIYPIFWTIDSRDALTKHLPLEQVIEQVRLQQGGVVLLHDHHALKKPEASRFTLQLTKRLLDLAIQEGWTICPVSRLQINHLYKSIK